LAVHNSVRRKSVPSIGEIEREYGGTIDAAYILGCSGKHIAKLVRAGRLQGARTRLGYLFRLEDVRALANERAGAAKDARGHVRPMR
jgi:excisionase family DNA binding protein